jgi:hypothetical protein
MITLVETIKQEREEYQLLHEHNSRENLHDETFYTFKEIFGFARVNNYQYNRHAQLSELELKSAIYNLTLNGRRRLKNAINFFRKRRTISSANRFYQYVYAKVLKSELRIRLNYPQKYLDIMEKRKIFVQKRKEMDAALVAYKLEKGNYFKQ